VDVEGCGRLSVHDGLLDVVCLVCASWLVRWRGVNVVVVGASGSALGDRKGLCERCLIRHQHALHQVDTYV
jgi:hypothetical protein